MTTGATRISAIIVHYKTLEETERAARAVSMTAPEAEIVVVDNASNDGIGALVSALPRVRVLTEPENRGYGTACNRGAAETAGEYLLFLNSDAWVLPGAVAALVSALDRDPRAAVAGPQLLDPGGSLERSIQRLPTAWRVFCESLGLAALSGGRGVLRGHTRTREDHTLSRAVTALKGAALAVRRSAFEEVGGFDETFFLYAEEADLLTRLARRGWRILFEPAARVTHVGGASSGDALFGLLHAGLRHYVEKHSGKMAARFAAASLSFGAAMRYGFALLTPGPSGRRRRLRYRAAFGRGAR